MISLPGSIFPGRCNTFVLQYICLTLAESLRGTLATFRPVHRPFKTLPVRQVEEGPWLA